MSITVIPPMPDVDVTIEFVTPDKAREYLSHNTHGHPIRTADVERYTQALREGSFLLTGDGIVFFTDGALANGQHRLLAVVEAGVGATFVVMRGLDSKVLPFIDNYLPRKK